MNKKFWIGLFVIFAMLVLPAGLCPSAIDDGNIGAPVVPTATNKAAPAQPTDAPADGNFYGVPPLPVKVTPKVVGEIDWNERLIVDNWIVAPGVAPNVTLQYMQSSVDGTLDLDEPFQVPAGTKLIVGGYNVSSTVEGKDGKSISFNGDAGIYGVYPTGTVLLKLKVTDGFVALALDKDAQVEFCARLAQAVAEKWALSAAYPDPSWQAPVCEGVIPVPVDSDRLHGGSLPKLTPTP